MLWNKIPQKSLIHINQALDELKRWDYGTYEHCLRVSHMTRELAVYAGLDAYNILVAQYAGLLHDIGKKDTPKEVLLKPAKLTDEEYHIMQDHPKASARVIEPITKGDKFFQDVHEAVLHHHERIDGRGYPFKLAGDEIPIISRMILIVDTIDAMTQNRAYRKGLPLEVAYQELDKFAGAQFDAELVNVFLVAKGFKKTVASKVG